MQKLCCRQQAPPFFPTAVLLPTQHKFHQHIRAKRSRCHAFTKVAANPASLVAGEQAQAVALPRRSSRRPHYQGGGGGRVPKGTSNLPDFQTDHTAFASPLSRVPDYRGEGGSKCSKPFVNGLGAASIRKLTRHSPVSD